MVEADHIVGDMIALDNLPGVAQVAIQGTPAALLADGNGSLTGAYLRGERTIVTPPARRSATRGAIVVKGARANNLDNVTVGFPLGCFTCVTGVSGGGKSSLVIETLYKSLARRLHGGQHVRHLVGLHATRWALAALLAHEELGDLAHHPHHVVAFGHDPHSAAPGRRAERLEGLVGDLHVEVLGP